MMTFADYKPFVLGALAWARWAMPATVFVVDALWVLNIAPGAAPDVLRRRRRMFATTARCSQPRVTRAFYSLLALAVIALERDRVRERLVRAEETRPFRDHEATLHNQEPQSATLRECQRAAVLAA